MHRNPALAVSFLLLISTPVRGSGNAPLGKVALLALLSGGTPAGDVARYVQQDGINFRPTEDFFKLIKRAMVENDPGKEQLTTILSAARLINPVATESTQETEILEHLARGAELASRVIPPNPEEYRVTEREFRQALEIDPMNPFLHLALGNALGYEERFDQAIAEFRETLRGLPDLSIAHLNLGRVLAGKGDVPSGLGELREAVRIDPTSPTARSVLARALLGNHDAAGAINILREGLRLQPDEPALHNTLGTVLIESGDVNSGIAEYWQAIRLGSKDPGVHADLAYALRRKGDLDGAIAELREAVRLDPNSFRRHHSLGAALVDKGDLPGANLEFREAIRLRPDYALSHSELGYVLKKQHDLDGAINQYHEAIRLDPKLPIAHVNLGAALYAKGQHDAAYEEVLIAHQLSPNDPTISEQFGKLPQRVKERAAQPANEPKPPRAPLGEPETANFLYYMDLQSSSLVPLEAETPTLGAKGNALGFGGMKGYITVIGERSPVRLKRNSKWEFVIRPADASLQLNFQFERFEAKGGSRTLTWRKELVPSSSTDRPGILIHNPSIFGKSSIKLSVGYDLKPGEYGFFVSAKGGGWRMFCFGVDSL